MPFSPWIPVLVSVVIFLAGSAVQGLALAYFLGKMKANSDATAAVVSTLLARMAVNDAAALANAEERGGLEARLTQVERNTSGVAAIAMDVAKFGVLFEAAEKARSMFQEGIRLDLSGVQRQIQVLMGAEGGALMRLERTK